MESMIALNLDGRREEDTKNHLPRFSIEIKSKQNKVSKSHKTFCLEIKTKRNKHIRAINIKRPCLNLEVRIFSRGKTLPLRHQLRFIIVNLREAFQFELKTE